MAKVQFVLGLAALSMAAVAQPQSDKASKPMSTVDFVTAAAQSDQYEILSSRIALISSKNPAVRGFAQQMIGDHTATSQALQQAAAAAGITPPPPGLGEGQARLLGALQGLNGSEFDKAYTQQQVLAHHQALVVEEGYATTGSDANIRKVAQNAVPVISQHLQMLGKIEAMVGGL